MLFSLNKRLQTCNQIIVTRTSESTLSSHALCIGDIIHNVCSVPARQRDATKQMIIDRLTNEGRVTMLIERKRSNDEIMTIQCADNQQLLDEPMSALDSPRIKSILKKPCSCPSSPVAKTFSEVLTQRKHSSNGGKRVQICNERADVVEIPNRYQCLFDEDGQNYTMITINRAMW
jgi:hypothetical protein